MTARSPNAPACMASGEWIVTDRADVDARHDGGKADGWRRTVYELSPWDCCRSWISNLRTLPTLAANVVQPADRGRVHVARGSFWIWRLGRCLRPLLALVAVTGALGYRRDRTFYEGTMGVSAAKLKASVTVNRIPDPTVAPYLAAGMIGVLAGLLNPAGPVEAGLIGAASSFGAGFGRCINAFSFRGAREGIAWLETTAVVVSGQSPCPLFVEKQGSQLWRENCIVSGLVQGEFHENRSI